MNDELLNEKRSVEPQKSDDFFGRKVTADTKKNEYVLNIKFACNPEKVNTDQHYKETEDSEETEESEMKDNYGKKFYYNAAKEEIYIPKLEQFSNSKKANTNPVSENNHLNKEKMIKSKKEVETNTNKQNLDRKKRENLHQAEENNMNKDKDDDFHTKPKFDQNKENTDSKQEYIYPLCNTDYQCDHWHDRGVHVDDMRQIHSYCCFSNQQNPHTLIWDRHSVFIKCSIMDGCIQKDYSSSDSFTCTKTNNTKVDDSELYDLNDPIALQAYKESFLINTPKPQLHQCYWNDDELHCETDALSQMSCSIDYKSGIAEQCIFRKEYSAISELEKNNVEDISQLKKIIKPLIRKVDILFNHYKKGNLHNTTKTENDIENTEKLEEIVKKIGNKLASSAANQKRINEHNKSKIQEIEKEITKLNINEETRSKITDKATNEELNKIKEQLKANEEKTTKIDSHKNKLQSMLAIYKNSSDKKDIEHNAKISELEKDTKEYNAKISELETKIDKTMHEKINTTFEEKINTIIDEKIDIVIDKKIDALIEEKINTMIDEKIDALIEEKINTMIDETIDALIEEKINTMIDETVDAIIEDKTDTMIQENTDIIIEKTIDVRISELEKEYNTKTSELEKKIKKQNKKILRNIKKETDTHADNMKKNLSTLLETKIQEQNNKINIDIQENKKYMLDKLDSLEQIIKNEKNPNATKSPSEPVNPDTAKSANEGMHFNVTKPPSEVVQNTQFTNQDSRTINHKHRHHQRNRNARSINNDKNNDKKIFILHKQESYQNQQSKRLGEVMPTSPGGLVTLKYMPSLNSEPVFLFFVVIMSCITLGLMGTILKKCFLNAPSEVACGVKNLFTKKHTHIASMQDVNVISATSDKNSQIIYS